MLLGGRGVGNDVGAPMTQDGPGHTRALLMLTLLLLMPLAGAINVTTFENGESEAMADVRDAATWMDTEDAQISLPAGQTITGASMTIGTAMAEHDSVVRIDTETLPKTWSPDANGQLTAFSAKNLSLIHI